MSTEGMTGTTRAASPVRPASVVPPRGPLPAPAPSRGRRAPCRSAAAALCVADVPAAAAALRAADAHAAAVLLVPGLTAVLNAAGGLYRPAPMTTALDDLPRLLGHAAVAWCAAAALLAPARPWPELLALITAHASLAAAAPGGAHHARRRAARRRPRPALVVGTGPAGQRVADVLAQHPEYGMRPVGLVGPVPRRLPNSVPLPVLTTAREVGRAVVRGAVRDAVFARRPEEALVRLFWARGCTVWLVAAEPGAAGLAGATGIWGRGAVAGHLWGFACRRLDPPPGAAGPRQPGTSAWSARWAKRALDVVVAATALTAAAPLFAGCALAVRLGDGPGVLFRQERIGKDGRPFVMLKFRTLRPGDAREAATRWSIAGDERITPVGRWLRRTSLDELPQLWNVLRGDMSLVGPRPERPHFVERFSRLHPGYADRHRMPVGLTGLAQISGLRGDTSIEDRARFDNLYIETWSLWQDVRIMLRTTAACFRLGGS
ncbi:sugar transferase [Streptomyces specialis]|uniref:sugar transferase n=1 Tax=Streptomyces specialis TaxID=498367 RepID=UPI00073F564D|nr:sugar transferase [Streptomyces specialis]